MNTLYAISLGISLSAAGGVRPFFTLLCITIAYNLGFLDLPHSLDWFDAQGVIFTILILFILETLGYLFKTQMFINNLFFETLAMSVGFFIMLLCLGENAAQYRWPIAILFGAAISGVIQGLFLLAKDDLEPRNQFFYNGYLAVIELLLALVIFSLSLLMPYLVAIVAILIVGLAFRKVFFRRISNKI